MTYRSKFCIMCVLFGAVIPFALLFVGAGFSLVPGVHPLLDRLSAYVVAVSLFLLAASYVLQRFAFSRD